MATSDRDASSRTRRDQYPPAGRDQLVSGEGARCRWTHRGAMKRLNPWVRLAMATLSIAGLVGCGDDRPHMDRGFSGSLGPVTFSLDGSDVDNDFRLVMSGFEMRSDDIDCMVDRLHASGLLPASGSGSTTVVVTTGQLDDWARQCNIRFADLRYSVD